MEKKRLRGFEIAKGWENKGINIPVRKTVKSAGYDIEAAEDTVIRPFMPGDKPTIIHTGLKVYCQDDEWCMLVPKSSTPFKKGLVMPVSVGVIDADYYGNPKNDGEIMYIYYNVTDKPVVIKKGEEIGQLVFQKFLVTDDDHVTEERIWGFHSAK